MVGLRRGCLLGKLLAGLVTSLLVGLNPGEVSGVRSGDNSIELLEGLERDEAEDYEPLLADLEAVRIDLNRASVDEVLALPALSQGEARSIVAYRKQKGAFRSTEELRVAGLVEPRHLEAIAPYVRVASPKTPVEVSLTSRSRVVLKSANAAGGFGDPSFAALKLYHSTTLRLGERAQAAFLTDKDHGEGSLGDFVAGYVDVRDVVGIDRVVAGDFRPGFGQGLLFGRFPRMGVSPVKQSPSRQLGYRSAAENGALRGLLVARSVGCVEITLLYSRTRRDARKNAQGAIETLLDTGLHVTESEKAAEDVLSERSVAGRLLWRAGLSTKLGATLAAHRFDPSLGPGDWEKEHFAFRGGRQTLFGLDWDVSVQHFNGFGEIAVSSKTGYGLVAGVLCEEKPVTLRLLARTYTPGFYAPYGTSFSSGDNANERGVYTEVEWRLTPRARMTLFLDQHRRPWRTYSIPVPVVGSSSGGTIEYRPHRGLTASLKLGSRNSQESASSEGGLLDKHAEYWHVDLRWLPDERLAVHGRVARSAVSFQHTVSSEQGALLFGDLRIALSESFTVDARLTFFDTDSYASRIYQFEDDLKGIFASRPMYGCGKRWYVILRGKLGPYELSAKYSRQHVLPTGEPKSSERPLVESLLGVQVDIDL